MNDDMLNGVVIMILVSCIISSLITEHAARTMALAEENGEIDMARGKEDERMLVSIANPETVEPLVNMVDGVLRDAGAGVAYL